MAKFVVEMDETFRLHKGMVRTRRVTEIPWTAGPRTRWQRIKRAVVG